MWMEPAGRMEGRMDGGMGGALGRKDGAVNEGVYDF